MSFSTSNRTSFNSNFIDTNTVGNNKTDISNIISILNQRNLQAYAILLEGENYEKDDGTFTEITFSTGMGSIVNSTFGVPISFTRANIRSIQVVIDGDISENFLIYGDVESEGISIDVGNGIKYVTFDNTIIDNNYVMINSNNSNVRSLFIKTAGQHTSSYVKLRISVFVTNYDTIVTEYNTASGNTLTVS